MTSSVVNSTPYPFTFDTESVNVSNKDGKAQISLENVRGRVPSLQASKLRALMLQADADPAKTMATTCTYDGLSSRLVEEAGFPLIFLAGYAMASAHGLPDTGYIAMQDVCAVIQQVARQVTVPIIADGDTGYGSPMNVKRCVESFALAGAAGVMIEDQTWPKRKSNLLKDNIPLLTATGCGHTKGKSVVGRGEAFARIQAAVDARNNGLDIWILARTDALIEGWDEAILRAKEFARIGVDAVFVEALPDKAAMEKCAKVIGVPVMANSECP